MKVYCNIVCLLVLYGDERLYNVLNRNTDKAPDELLSLVKADIDEFIGEMPQFDDITMLCLEYKKRCNSFGIGGK